MDHTEALPDDALADILRRLSPRDLGVPCCVRKAWLAVVDAHRLLSLNPRDLPHSVSGLCITYVDYNPSRLFVRPSARSMISLSFLPLYRIGIGMILDQCNGLLLSWNSSRTLRVVNPATRQWEDVAWENQNACPRLVFDPASSPHYEVFSIPRVPKRKGGQDDPHDLMEWPPSTWTLNVYSSSTRQWEMRSFIREGDVAGIVTNARLHPLEPIDMSWRRWGQPRWRYSAYWQGSLYVHCNDAFVVRYIYITHLHDHFSNSSFSTTLTLLTFFFLDELTFVQVAFVKLQIPSNKSPDRY
jgi:hypothetical protein